MEDELTELYENAELRSIKRSDHFEFYSALKESSHSIANFMSLGQKLKGLGPKGVIEYLSTIIKDQTVDVFGLFYHEKLIAFATYSLDSYSSQGIEITYWVRSSFQGRGVGKLLLYYLLRFAFGKQKFSYAIFMIDPANHGSVGVAESLGLTLSHRVQASDGGQGNLASGEYLVYFAFNSIIEFYAEEAGLEPLDWLHGWLWADACEKYRRSQPLFLAGVMSTVRKILNK